MTVRYRQNTRLARNSPPKGYIAWWRADLGVTHDASHNVTEWIDRTGKHTLFQEVAPPTLIKIGTNNHPLIRFNGTTHTMTTKNTIDLTSTAAAEIWVVFQHSQTGIEQKVFAYNTASLTPSFTMRRRSDNIFLSQLRGSVGVASRASSSSTIFNSTDVLNCRYDYGLSTEEAQGYSGLEQSEFTSTVLDNNNTDSDLGTKTFTLGSDGDEAGTAGIDAYEVILYPRTNTAREREILLQYFRVRYALT